MSSYRHLELLSRGPVSRVRLLDQRPLGAERGSQLASEWNAVAERADCRTLVVDCSNVKLLSSAMLSKLLLLQRRLNLRDTRLVLAGLRAEVREVLRWTRLDRFLEIREDGELEPAAVAWA